MFPKSVLVASGATIANRVSRYLGSKGKQFKAADHTTDLGIIFSAGRLVKHNQIGKRVKMPIVELPSSSTWPR